MRKWEYGVNYDNKKGFYVLMEAPWFVFLIGWFVEIFCDILYRLKISPPKWPMKDCDGRESNLAEEFSHLGGVFHFFVHEPIFQWAWKRTKEFYIEVPYEEIKERFYARDKKFFDDCERNVKELE